MVLDEQLDKTNEDLEAAAVPMPAFGNIQSALAKELDDGPSEEESNFFRKSNLSVRFRLSRCCIQSATSIWKIMKET